MLEELERRNFCVVNAVARSIKRVLRGGSISLSIFLAL
jgi:hypothetical protein